ncbi:MAG: mechanosensitive ion channel [Candidatus Kinetoplastibacterium crithidii]|nr:mechanosensitive ion channel [Candidatus Kinetoplastibacterium crithidii]
MKGDEIIRMVQFYIPTLGLLKIISCFFCLIIISLLVQWGISRLLVWLTNKVINIDGYGKWHHELHRYNVYKNILRSVPFFVISEGIKFVYHIGNIAEYISRFASAIIWVYIFAALIGLLSVIQSIYSARTRSIKVYIQVGKLLLIVIGIVLVLSVLINRSPLWMISGLGALSAVLLLVFKDTLLSLVAGTQLTTNDMLRIGDWIEMPQSNADGYVRDIALHTVKIQNWDNTVTTVPTYKLFSESYRNYRQMFESGGRRIKRVIYIDISSIRVMNKVEITELMKMSLLSNYLELNYKEQDHFMNISLFRYYMTAFLKSHNELRQDMPMLVRMMEQKSEGMPIEIYCFTALTAWAEHERIQGEIFDHINDIIYKFQLRFYQKPSMHNFMQCN